MTLALFGLLFCAGAIVCSATRECPFPRTRIADSETGSPWLAGVRVLCLVSVCACALAAIGDSWIQSQVRESADGGTPPAVWGALWIYAGALLWEWRYADMADAGRDAWRGAVVALAGVSLLGAYLADWAAAAVAGFPCEQGAAAIDATAPLPRATAALGLVLTPLASIALRLGSPRTPPFSTAAASAVAAAWMQPVFPSLGALLPLNIGAGAALAAVLVAAAAVAGLAARHRPLAAAAGRRSALSSGWAGYFFRDTPNRDERDGPPVTVKRLAPAGRPWCSDREYRRARSAPRGGS